jgi:hypothetical protein
MYSKPDVNIHEHLLSAITVLIDDNPLAIKQAKEMKNFNVEVFIKDLDKLFNDMQDKAIAGSENVATASWVIKQQLQEIEYWKEKFDKAMEIQSK